MRARIIVFFLIATLFSWTTAFSIAVPPHPDELHAKLISRVDNYELDAGSFVEALDRVAKEFQIPMGIEWIMTPAAETRVSMSWKDVSVLEIIESIIKTQTGYAVSFTNGAVQVSCSSLIRQSQNPGFVKINTFNVERTSLGWTSKLLRDQVKLVVSPLKATEPDGKPHGSGSSFISSTNEPMVSIALHNVAAQDILDKMVADSGGYIWILTFSEDKTLTPTGFRRTKRLWNNFPVPDGEQPQWDLFRWTDQIPPIGLGPK